MKKLIIYNDDYPDPESKSLGDEFVRERVEAYSRLGWSVSIIGYSKENRSYEYNGINVNKFNDKNLIIKKINENESRVMGVHFCPAWLVRRIDRIGNKKILVWVHGWEALSWYSQYFLIVNGLYFFAKYVLENSYQLYWYRKLISASNSGRVDCEFIFVSNWMRDCTERDCFISVRRSRIVSNPIDTNFYTNLNHKIDSFKNILMIRSFDTRKYATDVAVEFIEKLAQTAEFDKINIKIIGKGRYYSRDTDKLKKYKNITLSNDFLGKDQIKNQHADNGFFLCPTRQDAQGVSMCEAMSSGLIPITNPSTAIPEFAPKESGSIIAKTVDKMVEEYIFKTSNYDSWQMSSMKVRDFIDAKCNKNLIIGEEIKLIHEKAE
jgi:glycosyltransferase involved in cell wall biosynthesis